MKRYLLSLVSFILHLAAGAVIYYFWRPVALWYWHYQPVLGVDFYNFASYVGYLSRHFAFRFNGWKYIWWGGQPLALDYPTLHAYLVLPLLKVLSLPQAIQAYMLGSCFLFLFFSYLLFAEISRDRILAVILAVASSFSVALYGSLVWGGSLPYFASQFFLPLVLWALVKYFNTGSSPQSDPGSESYLRSGIVNGNRRWFYLSSLFLGISFLGHFQTGFSYIVPISFFLLLFYLFPKEKFFSIKRLKRLFSYFLIAVLVGYPQLGAILGFAPLAILLKIPRTILLVFDKLFPQRGEALPGVVPTTSPEAIKIIAQFQKEQLGRLTTETSPLFFTLLAAGGIVFLLTLIIRHFTSEVSARPPRSSRFCGESGAADFTSEVFNHSSPRRSPIRLRSGPPSEVSRFFRTFVFALPVLWVIFYISLYAYGIGLFHGGWYRVFWPFPLTLGILIAFIWGDFWASVKERLGALGQKPIFRFLISALPGVIILFPGYILLSQNPAQKMLTAIETPLNRQQSSAFPDSLNVEIEKDKLADLKGKLTPSWLDPNETNYRLYEADQRVNIWWNALFDMPLVKGYIDPPAGDSSGGFYWTSIALSQTSGRDALVESWGVPEEMAYQNALFLLDWYSIKYIEAEHEPSDSFNPPASYLAKSDIFAQKEKVVIPGLAQLYMIEDGQPIAWHPDKEEYLTYYQVKEDLVSPIAHPANASTIGVIGAVDAYRTILRSLAAVNLNSRRVIPLQLGQLIDNVSYQDLRNMDLVILYAYDYRNHGQAWGKLEKYVKEGGKVLIETGSEVKQTDSVNLPDKYPKELPSIFPIKMTKKGEMGKRWDLSGEGLDGISSKAFGPPIFDDGQPWLFSHPNSIGDLKEGARVILANQGIPLVVSWPYGKGEVIWSGMNLPYHIIVHKNLLEEAKFFQKLLENPISTDAVDYSGYTVERKSASKMVVKGNNARGVFFREQNYEGWKAKLKAPARLAADAAASKRARKSSKLKAQKLKIYRGGPTYPGFMYVVIPEEIRDSDFEVTFSYQGDFWSYFWPAISLSIIIILLDKIIFNSRLVIPVIKKVSDPLSKRVGGWWEKEED